MRVLHLPWNVASQISIMVRALRGIGVEAPGLARWESPMHDYREVEVFRLLSRRRHPFCDAAQTISWWCAFARAVKWAEVIHWHSGAPILPGHLCLRYIAFLSTTTLFREGCQGALRSGHQGSLWIRPLLGHRIAHCLSTTSPLTGCARAGCGKQWAGEREHLRWYTLK